jgi:hypothetical protein
MTRAILQDRPPVPTGLPPERALRWCLLSCLRRLQRSIRRGRTISLPNLLRLHQRQWAELARHSRATQQGGLHWLAVLYHQEQPFANTDWRRWRRKLRGGGGR